MNLTELESMLRKNGVGDLAHASDGSLVVKYKITDEDKHSFFPIYFSEAGGGAFRGEIRFRRVAAKEIEYTDTFCRFINERWQPVTIAFDKANRRFCLATPVEPEHVGEDVGVLLAALYQIEPICLVVGKSGKWVSDFHHFMDLATLQPNEHLQ